MVLLLLEYIILSIVVLHNLYSIDIVIEKELIMCFKQDLDVNPAYYLK